MPRVHAGFKRQRGTFAVMSPSLIILIIIISGFALDLGLVYNRRVEMHGLAKAVALAAARELDGTSYGIDQAKEKAEEVAESFLYQYGHESVSWNEAALSFGNSYQPADWVPAGSARSRAAGLYYVQVDTSVLDPDASLVQTLLMRVIAPRFETVNVRERAVAGRTAVTVSPLAICAMSSEPGASRTNPDFPTFAAELVQYGFRRGVSYDLMRLNPGGTSPVNYVIDPILPPGVSGTANTTKARVAPFVCTGTMWMPGVSGGTIKVASPFPLADLFREFNSRFDDYAGTECQPNGAPPDQNIKPYHYASPSTLAWMTPTSGLARAKEVTVRGRLETVADLDSASLALVPGGVAAGDYGPLWTYRKAAKFADFVRGEPEPFRRYSSFAKGDWSKLYKNGPSGSNYPSTIPYESGSSANYDPPSENHKLMATADRRVLNVALLSCPVTGGSAEVLGIGKFFMTVPATSTSLIAEFAGLAPEQSLGQVELYP